MLRGFQAESVEFTVYLSNRSSTRSLQNITPQEAQSGWKSNIAQLKIFGSIAYTYIADQRREKLDDKSEKFVFIGYGSSLKGYKLYNLKKWKICPQQRCPF